MARRIIDEATVMDMLSLLAGERKWLETNQGDLLEPGGAIVERHQTLFEILLDALGFPADTEGKCRPVANLTEPSVVPSYRDAAWREFRQIGKARHLTNNDIRLLVLKIKCLANEYQTSRLGG